MAHQFKPRRLVRSCEHHYPAPMASVFPLLCPVREYEWIDIWQCRMLWSQSGVAEDNCIFTTDFPDLGREVWVVSRYEPPRAIEFVRVSANLAIRLNIHLEAEGGDATRARWTHAYTSLNPAGNAAIDKWTDGRYDHEMRLLETLLDHYLRTGKMLTGITGTYRGRTPDAHDHPGGQAG